MKKLIAVTLAASVMASAAFAGGPVIVEEDVVIVEKPASSVGILPLLLIPIILCVALCGSDEEDPLPTNQG